MKLKKVTVTFEYVIAVEDDATDSIEHRVAANSAHEALKDMSVYDLDIDVEDYTDGSVSCWTDDCIPYGGDSNTRTGEYIR